MSEHPDVLDGNAATATDVQLINRGAGGERDAIAGLYARHGARVYTLAHRMLRNSTDAFPKRAPANQLPLTTYNLPARLPPKKHRSATPVISMLA